MGKVYEFHHNKVHHINIDKTVKENIATNRYLRDFYLKDFKYISPEVLEAKYNRRKTQSLDANGKITCRSLFKKWLEEVMRGLKQFLYQGSLHGVK